jgi:hypothetical protein
MGRNAPPHAVSSGAPEPGRQRVNFSIHIFDLTGIFTVCCLMAADFGSVIFITPLEKSIFTDLGPGPNAVPYRSENRTVEVAAGGDGCGDGRTGGRQ